MSKILFKFPTRARPEKFKETLRRYRDLLSNKHTYEWRISCDSDDRTMNNPAMIKHLTSIPGLSLHFGNSKSKIEAINADMSSVDFDILVLISDDMLPQVKDFDDIIAKNMNEHFPNLDGVLHFNDGRAGQQLNTLVIMGKNIYQQIGYIYHPQYKSLWCDNEFHDVTYGMNKAKFVDMVIIKHAWVDYTGPDALHKRNESYFQHDKKIYLKRKAEGFPKEFVK